MYTNNSFKKEKSNIVTVLIATVLMALAIYLMVGIIDAPEKGVCQDSYSLTSDGSVVELYYKSCPSK